MPGGSTRHAGRLDRAPAECEDRTMPTMWRRVLGGAAAGAAGTTALDAVTYLDMAVRGRPASSTPQQSVERVAEVTHLQVPGDHETRGNRLQGLGPLLGILTGVTVGAAYGLLHERLRNPSPFLGATLVGGGAMLAANVPMAVLGISDPRTWTTADWLSDVVPHLAYGAVTAYTYDSVTR
jgi:hypothetical protein